jgi:CRAL/TRIO, N-terminal domain
LFSAKPSRPSSKTLSLSFNLSPITMSAEAVVAPVPAADNEKSPAAAAAAAAAPDATDATTTTAATTATAAPADESTTVQPVAEAEKAAEPEKDAEPVKAELAQVADPEKPAEPEKAAESDKAADFEKAAAPTDASKADEKSDAVVMAVPAVEPAVEGSTAAAAAPIAEENPAADDKPTADDKATADDKPKTAEPAKAVEASTADAGPPSWPELADHHPLAQFQSSLPNILKAAEYDEVYGITLKPKPEGSVGDFLTLLILQKFLRANQNDLEKAQEQLLGTLKWRKEYQPQKAVEETFGNDKFNGLGYVTTIDGKDGKQIVTWNIYGAVKDYEKTFVPLEE